MSAATLEAVGLAAPRQPTWAFQHATSGLFAPVLDVPGSRSAPTLSFAVPAAPLPAQAGLLVKGHPLSSSSGSLQMSCQLPPAGGQPQTLAAALRPPSEGTSSDVPPMLSAASDEAGASAGDSRAGGTQLLGQKAGMRQVDSQGSLAQDDSESSEREDGSKQPRAKKPRLVWTSELHQRFINAVTHLVSKQMYSSCQRSLPHWYQHASSITACMPISSPAMVFTVLTHHLGSKPGHARKLYSCC